MKQTPNKLKPERVIRIPKSLSKTLDKMSLLQLKQIDKIVKKEWEREYERIDEQNRQSQVELELDRKFRSLSVQTRKSNRYESVQARETEKVALSRSKSSSKIRFRTTGAGFRQRVNTKPPVQPITERPKQTRMTFRKSSVRPTKTNLYQNEPQQDYQRFREFIEEKTKIRRKEQLKQKKTRPHRLIFGQHKLFKDEPQFVYNQKFTPEDIQWSDEVSFYKKMGFGVSSDLSLYDIPSLEDPEGQNFMLQHSNEIGWCPLYQGDRYSWMEVKVVGFDKETKQIIVDRIGLGDFKKVSRLSIRFGKDQQSTIRYWNRVHQAKKYQFQAHEHNKFNRYIFSRSEQISYPFKSFDRFPMKWQKSIQSQWFTYYSRLLLIYREMKMKPEKFTDMGIKLRQYEPFAQIPIKSNFGSYEDSKDKLKTKHYSKFERYPETVYTLFDRLTLQTCQALHFRPSQTTIQQLSSLQCKKIQSTIKTLTSKIREYLISDIMGTLAFTFKSREEQQKYYRIHDSIYRDLILSHLYIENVKKWVAYISSFEKWTRETPEPIVKLTIDVDAKGKKVNIQPEEKEVIELLFRPLDLLQKETKKIPDLISQINGGKPTTVKVTHSLPPSAQAIITKITRISFTPVLTFAQSYTDKLQYLQKIQWQRQTFNHQGRQRYSSTFNTLKEALREVTHTIIGRCGFLVVDSQPLKKALSEAIIKQRNRLGRIIEKQIDEQIDNTNQQFASRTEYLKTIPKSQYQLVSMRHYLNHSCQQFLQKAHEHYLLCHQFFLLLEDHFITYSMTSFEKNMQMTLIHRVFINTINKKLYELVELERKMIERINEERQAIMKGMEQMVQKMEVIKGFHNLAEYNQNYRFSNMNYMLLEGYVRQLQDINQRQKTLCQQISVFPMLTKLQKQLRPYYQLWNIVYELTNQLRNMKDEPIHKINHNMLRDHILQWSKELQRLNSVFTSLKNASVVHSIEILNDRIKQAQEKLWLVRAFTLEGVLKKEVIRKEILETVFKGRQYNFTELTMDELLKAGVQQHTQYVIQNAQKAQRIWQLELRIQAIVNTVKVLELVLTENNNVPIFEDKLLLSLSCAVHQQLDLMDDIKDLPQAQYIQKKVNNVHNRLKCIEETLTLMRQFQDDFFKLRQLVLIEQIGRQLDREKGMFSNVEKIWRGICGQFSKDVEVWQAIDNDSYKNKLENMIKIMAQVDRKVDEVIDKKKQIFPRLFYLEKEQVKQLVVKPEMVALSRYMEVLFAGVRGWLGDQEKIRGVVGRHGEYVNFKKGINKSLVWHNLRAVSDELGRIVAWELNISSNRKPAHSFGRAARLMVETTYTLEQAISRKELKKIPQRLKQELQKNFQSHSVQSCMMASILLHFRDKSLNLINKNVSDLRNFQWKKQLRYYKSETEGIQLRTINLLLPFQNQYPSTDVRPYFLLTDKVVIQMLVSAWTMNTGMVLQGHTNTIRQLCSTTHKHYTEIAINSQTSMDRVCSILKAYTLSLFTWTTIVIESPICREIFDLIAQTAYELHGVIESGRTLFTIGGKFFNISKQFRFNLFLKRKELQQQSQQKESQYLEVSGHENKSYKFGLAFRNISLASPTQQTIVKFYLNCLGFTQEQLASICGYFDQYKAQNMKKWYHNSFFELLNIFKEEHLKQQRESCDVMETFEIIWRRELSKQHSGQLFGCSAGNMISEKTLLTDVILSINQNRHEKSHVMLVGPHLSGKKHIITTTFFQLHIPIIEPLQYDVSQHLDSWLCLQQKFYTREIPSQQKLILRTNQTVSIEPNIGIFVVLYHREHLQWNQMLPERLKQSGLSIQLQKEITRQLTILFNHPMLAPSESTRAVSISLCLSLLKILELFHSQGKIVKLNLIQRQQIVFMFLYWQTAAIVPHLTLDPLLFGSSIPREPMNYYYDIQKSAWLEWVTLNEYHRSNNTNQLRQLFVPIRQSMSSVYFLSHCLHHSNLYINSQAPGLGLHHLLSSLLAKGLIQFYRTHKNVSYSNFSRLINYDVAIFKKEGKYFPKLNQKLTIVVEDVALSMNQDFENRLAILVNHRYDSELKREIARTTLVCTDHQNNQSQYEKNMLMSVVKHVVQLKIPTFSYQSRATIFNFYLEWFFGNTENPFSKEVRIATESLVQCSIHLMQTIRKGHSSITFGKIVQVFEGLCISSPKTVKSTQDIIELWWHECRNVLCNCEDLQDKVNDFLEERNKEFNYLVMQLMNVVVNKEAPVFVRHGAFPISYADTYQKVDKKTLYSYLQQAIKNVDFNRFSHLPLVIYPDLLHFITKVLRIFNIPHRHLLLYGGRFSCQKIIFRLASLLHYNKDCVVITNTDHWQQQLATQLKPMISNGEPKCVAFSLAIKETDTFLEVIEEMVILHHPRSLLLQEGEKYLKTLGLSSAGSSQYKTMTKNVKAHLTCCLSSPQQTPASLQQHYPALMRRIQYINSLQNYTNGGLTQLASVSIGSFYTSISHIPFIDSIFSLFGQPISKQKWLRILQLSLHYYSKSIQQIQRQLKEIEKAVSKTRAIQHQKTQLQKQLAKLNKTLAKVVQKVELLLEDYKKHEGQYQQMLNNYRQHRQQCELYRQKTDLIQQDVDQEYSKVEPILSTAQDAMAKVTRDDINQLRSFPNPPLPAVKVVESLVFLFNESHLVKENVLENGEKVRNFWQYAKKMILNDQLLKRVKDLNPQTIKSMAESIIATLKGIIKRPEFLEERVFKASSAAGNLSLWVKAIVEVYDVMVIIEPKRRILSEVLSVLHGKQDHLASLQEEIDKFHQLLMSKKKLYDEKVEQREAVQSQIRQIEKYIENAGEILSVLHSRQKEWKIIKETQLPQLRRQCQLDSVIISIYIELLVPLGLDKRSQIVDRLKEEGFNCNPTFLYRYPFLQQYQQYFFSLLTSQLSCKPTIPLVISYTEGLVTLHQQLSFNKRIILVHDQTKLLKNYLMNESVAQMCNKKIEILDCLEKQDVSEFLLEGSNLYEQEQSESDYEEKEKKIIVLTQLEHCRNYLEKYAQITKKYQQHQLIILIQLATTEFLDLMSTTHISFDLTLHSTDQLASYLTKEAFKLPLITFQELSRSFLYQNTKRTFFNILSQNPDLIRNEQILKQWLSYHHKERKMKSQKPVFKQCTKIQEQKVIEVVDVLSRHKKIKSTSFLKVVDEYFKNQELTVEPTLNNFPQYLGKLLEHYPDSVVKVVQPQSQQLNPLGYYLLKYENIDELQQTPKPPDECSSPHPLLGIEKHLSTLSFQIVNPFLVFHAIKNNQHAFISLTNKYKLQKALKECQTIQALYRNEYFQQFYQRDKSTLGCIYLLSECGNIEVDEVMELEPEEGDGYFMQNFRRKFRQMNENEEKYMSEVVFQKKQD